MNDEYTFPEGTGRRRFIKGTGSLVALGSLPGYLAANTEMLASTFGDLQQRQGIVLYRDNEIHSRIFADTLSAAGIHPVALTDDPVRQWRNSLQAMPGDNGMPLMGLTNWADYLIISGLAAEQRRHVMLELQHAVHQPEKKNWSGELAVEYLQIPETADKNLLQAQFSKTLTRPISPGSRSLFSWLIA